MESLVGQAIADGDSVSVSVIRTNNVPEALRRMWDSAERAGLDKLSAEEIDAEIRAVRAERKRRS